VVGRRVLLIAAGAALLVAGCGGGDDGSTTSPATQATTPSDGAAKGGRVRLQKVGDFDTPVYVTQPAGTGDLYVVEQGGTVRIVRDGGTVAGPALDISGDVTAGGEQGLLSIAFPPDFQSSRLVYAYYTGRDQDQHVDEWRVGDDGVFDPGSRREVMKMDDFASNHNGGLLLFGPDGQMYIGTGDGGIGDDVRRQAQDLGSPLGKLLRIDPRQAGGRPYSVPEDNPFAGRAGARPEIYSYGLRNPWRFSFDRETDALTIADVGQNEFEEVDYTEAGQARGANFGWSAFEGDQRFNQDVDPAGAVPPIYVYGHDRGCSITGGYVVRDPSLPSLAGRYVYGDYCEGELHSFVPAVSGARGDRSLGLKVDSLDSFGEDQAGHVYAVSQDGPVYRLASG
jgi:glucose/arabinose dehydrogenase